LKIRVCISFLFFTLFSASLFSQGLQEGFLTSNPVLVKASNQLKSYQQLLSASINDTIDLDTVRGILDDFSYDSVYPDSALWLDKYVYVNRGYPIAPVTIGAATFDGLDAGGYPYNFFVTSTSSNPADSLTSKPINLLNYSNSGSIVNYQLSDSLYFSFYYQPQGRGNDPQPSDSLVLEFFAPGFTDWQHIWSVPGSALAATDSSWTLVMVPITNIQFLKRGFQFRFRNYATISGNLDHWSIDYVYLNKYRTHADTIFEDVSFVYNTPSLLNLYTMMPWKHYSSSFMKTSFTTTIRNNYTAPKNASFNYRMYDQTGTQVYTASGGSDNLDPFVPNGYTTSFSNPSLGYTIPTLTDTTNYTLECTIFTNPDKHRANDTVRHRQEFYNYYAYDDGTAETAFYLNTLNAQMAEKFVSTIDDSLRCIDIYFNPIVTNASQYAFSLNVWADAGGSPGTAIYTSDSVRFPSYTHTGENQMVHYYLDAPLFLPAGLFYVGFTQKTTEQLNIGVDKNTNSQTNVYYNVSGTWQTSSIPGSLLMHPVFGVADFQLGVTEYRVPLKKANGITVYPNPANDKLYINFSATDLSEKITYSIIDMYGRTVVENNYETAEYIDIVSLSNGIYFIRVANGNQLSTVKFIKTN
jgi:hypothetical protein